MDKLPEDSGFPAFVAQRIEHLTTDQKVGGSSPSKRTETQEAFTTSWASSFLLVAVGEFFGVRPIPGFAQCLAKDQ